jgi:hypothetical protein
MFVITDGVTAQEWGTVVMDIHGQTRAASEKGTAQTLKLYFSIYLDWFRNVRFFVGSHARHCKTHFIGFFF